MNISGEYRIAAPRRAVWDALNDSETLQVCIPGCQHLVRVGATEIEASILARLGPVKSTFAARIVLSNLNPPTSYTLSGEGKSGAAGFGRGEAQVRLADEPGATVLRYAADFKLGGKLAQLGSRLIEGAARQLADEFFSNFAARLDPAAQRTPSQAAAKRPRLSLAWPAIALVLLAATLFWWLA